MFQQLAAEIRRAKGELLDQIAGLYADELTLEELNAIVAFYKSPVGAKFVAVQPQHHAPVDGARAALGPADRPRDRCGSAPGTQEARYRALGGRSSQW